MKTATFRYKCKQCGDFCSGVSTHPDNAQLVLLSVIAGDPDLNLLKLFGKDMFSTSLVHYCNDKEVGLADIVGYIVEDK